MSKKQKKRNKTYSGAQADKPRISRYTAVTRSPLGEWWHDNNRRIKLTAGISGGVLVMGYLIYEFLRLVF